MQDWIIRLLIRMSASFEKVVCVDIRVVIKCPGRVIRDCDMSRHVKLILIMSCGVVTSLGVLFIYNHWSGSNPSIAYSRSILFALIAAILHVVGFALYARQFAVTAAGPPAPLHAEDQPRLEFLRVVLLQQIPLLALTALLLDGGHVFRSYCVGAIAHWSLIAIILLGRRPLTRLDVFLIRWGFIPLVMLAVALTPLVVG